MATHDDDFEDEIANLRRKVPSITDLNVQRLRQARDNSAKPATTGARVKRLEKRVKELDLEVQSLRNQIRRLEKFVGME